jgi:hypothetical protein
VAAGWLLATVAIVAAVSSVSPLAIECGTLERTECRDTVKAAVARGLPWPHPLALAAHVTSGPAWPAAMGHRATVAFDLAGVPGRATVRLYYDIGGHWGGVIDRATPEVAGWSFATAGIIASGVMVALGWLLRRRPRGAAPLRGRARRAA